MRSWSVAVVFAAAVSLVPLTASANSGGLAGYTGKPNPSAPQGESCNKAACHNGGTAPTVAINGPATLAAGQTAEYTLVVSTGSARAGAGVAGSDGVVLTAGTGLRDSFGEMVHNGPLTVSGGAATFRFTVKAPATGTSMRLYAVGLAANNSGSVAGDRAAQMTKDVTVTGGGVTPPPTGSSGGTPGTDGGTMPPGDGDGDGDGEGDGTGAETGDEGSSGSPGSSGGTGDEGNGASPDDGDGESSRGAGGGRGLGSGAKAGSCASIPGSLGSEAIGLVLGFGAMVLGARRRRSTK